MSSKWLECKFEDVLSQPIRNGLSKPKAVRGKGIKMINMGEIFKYNRIYDIEMDRVPTTHNEYISSKLDKGDLLFARQSLVLEGAGKCSIIMEAEEDLVYESHLIRARLNKKIADPLFYYYYFNSPSGKGNIHSIVEQVAAAGIRGSDLIKLTIPFPSLDEQKAIADTLSCLDDMIELNNRTNQVLEEIAQAIFKRWFVDFEFPNEDGEPYKSSGGEMVDSELEEIPKGWKIGYINEICKVIYGAPFKSSLFNNVNNGWPLIRIRDLKTFTPQFYTNEHNPRTEFVQPGDILVGMDAEFRPCIWKGNKGVLNQRVCKFEPKLNEVCRFFVYSIIKPHLEFIEGYKVGTTVSHIGKGDIDKIQLIIPSNDVLVKLKNTVEPSYVAIIDNCKENRILETIRDSLLPKLVSGEIRVPIEEVV